MEVIQFEQRISAGLVAEAESQQAWRRCIVGFNSEALVVMAPGMGIGMVAIMLLSEVAMPGKGIVGCMIWGRACRGGLVIDSSDSAEDEDEGLTGRAYAQ